MNSQCRNFKESSTNADTPRASGSTPENIPKIAAGGANLNTQNVTGNS